MYQGKNTHMRNTKHLKRFLTKGSWVILASFFLLGSTALYAFEIPFLANNYEPELLEYKDPSKDPRYNLYFTEVEFDGLKVKDLQKLQELTGIVLKKDGISPSVMIGEGDSALNVESTESLETLLEKTNNAYRDKKLGVLNKGVFSSSFETLILEEEVSKISFNSTKDDQRVALLNGIKNDSLTSLDEAEVNQKERNVEDGGAQGRVENHGDLGQKIAYIQTFSNKELMDLLYPSEEEVQNTNEEILLIEEAVEEYNLDRIWKKEERNERLLSLLGRGATASNLNNFVSSLVIYPRSNPGLRMDLMWNVAQNGQEFHLWDADVNGNGGAQKLRLYEVDSTIRLNRDTSYCLDVAGGSYYNGAKVQLYKCSPNNSNQQWVIQAENTGSSIRPLNRQDYCLDIDTVPEKGRKLQLWSCVNNDNQKFYIGEEEFGKFDYHMRLHSRKSGNVSSGSGSILSSGHTLVSMHKKERSNGFWHTTNTFGFWGSDTDTDAGNYDGRTNNMMNYQSHLLVDDGLNHTDWNVGRAHPADAGGEFGAYRRTTQIISKQANDKIKYGNAYKVDNYVNAGWVFPCQICSTYAVRLWNPYTGGTNYNNCWTPGAIYNVL
jgi:hypothetical protein